jgi:hypothetical protein
VETNYNQQQNYNHQQKTNTAHWQKQKEQMTWWHKTGTKTRPAQKHSITSLDTLSAAQYTPCMYVNAHVRLQMCVRANTYCKW